MEAAAFLGHRDALSTTSAHLISRIPSANEPSSTLLAPSARLSSALASVASASMLLAMLPGGRGGCGGVRRLRGSDCSEAVSEPASLYAARPFSAACPW